MSWERVEPSKAEVIIEQLVGLTFLGVVASIVAVLFMRHRELYDWPFLALAGLGFALLLGLGVGFRLLLGRF